MTNNDLFSSQSSMWVSDPITSFDTWLSQQRGRGGAAKLRVSSAEVYRAQWGKFLDFIQKKGIKITQVTETDIVEFLASLHSENRSQRDRYRKLIERVLTDLHRDTAPVGFVNPAAAAAKVSGAEWKGVSGNLPTSFLSIPQRMALIEYLRTAIRDKTPEERRREIRDRAMVATYLGAGLKVSEILRLTVNCVSLHGEYWINVRRPDSKFSHRSIPQPFAREMILRWLAERERSGYRGDILFPADLDGRIMHPVTALRAADAIIAASGITRGREDKASPQTLRNSYAAGLFESGESTKSVCDSLGFAVLVTGERLKASWQSWRAFQPEGGNVPGRDR